jgi:hypothetical protein
MSLIKELLKIAVVIAIVSIIDTGICGITSTEIKAATKSWVGTVTDWMPGIMGAGVALAGVMFFLNKYAYGLGAAGGVGMLWAAKAFMGDGQACLVDMAQVLFG